MMAIEGLCSLERMSGKDAIAIICKTGNNEYKKHYLGLSDNVTYIVEQLESKNVSTSRYNIVFKPISILPDVEIK